MKKRNFIFGGLAGVLFIAFTAVNVTVSQSYKQEGTGQFTLHALNAKANSGAEYDCSLDKYGAGICVSLYGDICTASQESCSLAFF